MYREAVADLSTSPDAQRRRIVRSNLPAMFGAGPASRALPSAVEQMLHRLSEYSSPPPGRGGSRGRNPNGDL